jgi:hypothetical protein
LIDISLLVLEETIFFKTNTCKYGFPYCGPSWPPKTMVWTNLNLHYIRKLSCKYELFWLSGLWEEDFKCPHPIFAFLWLSPLWKGPGPWFVQFWIPFYLRMICTKIRGWGQLLSLITITILITGHRKLLIAITITIIWQFFFWLQLRFQLHTHDFFYYDYDYLSLDRSITIMILITSFWLRLQK